MERHIQPNLIICSYTMPHTLLLNSYIIVQIIFLMKLSHPYHLFLRIETADKSMKVGNIIDSLKNLGDLEALG